MKSPSGDRPRPKTLALPLASLTSRFGADGFRLFSGYDQPDLEVVQRTLRVKDQGGAGTSACDCLLGMSRQSLSPPVLR